jgi:hypothetical protein
VACNAALLNKEKLETAVERDENFSQSWQAWSNHR